MARLSALATMGALYLITMWIEGGAGIGSDVIHAVRQNNLGGTDWSSMIASDPAYRARLASTVSDEQIIAAWQVGDFGVADIQAHNLNADGSLGVAQNCRSDLNSDGIIDFFDVSILITAFNEMDPIADINLDSIINFF